MNLSQMPVYLSLVILAGHVHAPPTLDGRNVGGSETTIENAPYQVSIQSNGSHLCGGSIINETFIVTSGRCTYGYSVGSLSVRAGGSLHSIGSQLKSVDKIYHHKDFNISKIDYDISIVELKSPLNFSNSVQPVRLPKKDQAIPIGSTATCTGWGITLEGGSIRPTVYVAIVSLEQYAQDYKGYTERMICAAISEGGKGTCQGDSGGALVVDGQLVGIASWSNGCACKGYPGVYSSVPNLRDFITNITGY